MEGSGREGSDPDGIDGDDQFNELPKKKLRASPSSRQIASVLKKYEVPGKKQKASLYSCYSCGESGHWVKDCPKKPVVVEPYFQEKANETHDVHAAMEAALHTFGLKQFHPDQKKVILKILSGESTLAVLPSGTGKSLCYQLPAYLYSRKSRCATLVVVPLISLMEDQIFRFPGGIKGLCLHSNMDAKKQLSVLNQVMDGEVSVLLITPEGLMTRASPSGTHPLHRLPIGFVCIDEVHCISEWSYYIRPSYLRVCKVLQDLGIDRILGLTATATSSTTSSLEKSLGKVNVIYPHFRIPNNLDISVSHETDRDKALLQLLKAYKMGSMKPLIIYCETRKHVNHIQYLLNVRGIANTYPSSEKRHAEIAWKVGRYHSEVPPDERSKVQKKFTSGELEIVVATVAFGMGLSVKGVRATVHYSLPQNLDRFVQEITRAGRDGCAASCHAFIGKEGDDVSRASYLIRKDTPDIHTISNFVGLIAEFPGTKGLDGLAKVQLTRASIDRICKTTLKITEKCLRTLLCLIESYGVIEIVSFSSKQIIFKRTGSYQSSLGEKLHQELMSVEESRLNKLQKVDDTLRDSSHASFQKCVMQHNEEIGEVIEEYFNRDVGTIQQTTFAEFKAPSQISQGSKPMQVASASTQTSTVSHRPQSSHQFPERIEVGLETDSTCACLGGMLDDQPTLPKLLKFPGKKGKINIPKKIGTHYDDFGIHLLGDDTGERIAAISERYKDAKKINLSVLTEWLTGKGRQPVTWGTLIDALEDAELTTLASDIRKAVS